MTNDPQEEAERRYVRRRVRGLRHHILVYLCVIGGIGLVAAIGGHAKWVVFPAAGWGIGLLAHAVSVFGVDIGRGWEDKLVEHLMARRRRRPGPSSASTQAGPDRPLPPPL